MTILAASFAILFAGLGVVLVTIGGVGLVRTLILDVQRNPTQGSTVPIMNAAVTLGLGTVAFLTAHALDVARAARCHG